MNRERSARAAAPPERNAGRPPKGRLRCKASSWRFFQPYALGAQTSESGMRGKSEVAAILAQEPVASDLGNHLFKVVTVDAVRTTNTLGFLQLRPIDHPATHFWRQVGRGELLWHKGLEHTKFRKTLQRRSLGSKRQDAPVFALAGFGMGICGIGWRLLCVRFGVRLMREEVTAEGNDAQRGEYSTPGCEEKPSSGNNRGTGHCGSIGCRSSPRGCDELSASQRRVHRNVLYCSGAGAGSWLMRCCMRASCCASICLS